MEGYEVVSVVDEKTLGHVVGRVGDILVVEHGTVFSHLRPVPRRLAEVDDAERRVRLMISEQELEAAPAVEHGRVDEDAVLRHYASLAGSEPVPKGS